MPRFYIAETLRIRDFDAIRSCGCHQIFFDKTLLYSLVSVFLSHMLLDFWMIFWVILFADGF